MIPRPVYGNKSNSPIVLDTNFGLGICRKNQRRGWGRKECYFHWSHGLKIMVVGSTDVVRSVGASGSSEAEALSLSLTYTLLPLSLSHSLPDTLSLYLGQGVPGMVVVPAMWAAELLLKPGPDADYGSQVGEVGSQNIAFSSCPTHYLELWVFILILFFGSLVKFSFFGLLN